MNIRRLALAALPVAVVLATGVPAHAAGAVAINVTHPCSHGSLGNLQVQTEDTGRISLDFGVDMARHSSGVVWHVWVTDNGHQIAHGTVRTGADGSFSLTRLTKPRGGTNHIAATATNAATGERCLVTATF